MVFIEVMYNSMMKEPNVVGWERLQLPTDLSNIIPERKTSVQKHDIQKYEKYLFEMFRYAHLKGL